MVAMTITSQVVINLMLHSTHSHQMLKPTSARHLRATSVVATDPKASLSQDIAAVAAVAATEADERYCSHLGLFEKHTVD